jgi:hypothetical protein
MKVRRLVREGVVIEDLDVNKPISKSESSLELILISLSNAFKMKPR